jgi:hypothetical protein
MANSAIDRRKHTRVPTNLDFSLLLNDLEFKGTVGNISLSGAFLSEPEPEIFPSLIAQPGYLTIVLNSELLRFKCEVVYAVGHENTYFPVGAGVIFSETDEETQVSIIKVATALNLS